MKKNIAIRTAGAFFLVIGGLAIAAAPAQANETQGAAADISSSITWQTPAPVEGSGSITWQTPAPVEGSGSITWQIPAPASVLDSITWQ